MEYQLPSSWESVTLGDISLITYGKGLPTKNLLPSGYPVFGANSVIGFYDNYLYEDSQLLISCRGAGSGTINFSPPKCFITNNSLIIGFPTEADVLRKTFYYFLQSVNKDGLITGSAQPQVTINNAVELKLNLPPLNEQKRIVTKIEELFSELDSGIASLKTAQEKLKVYRQAVLKHAFEGKLTAQWREKNEKHIWTQQKVGNLITFLTSGSRGWAQYYSDSGDTFIRAQNLKYDRLDLTDRAYVSLPEKAEGKRTQVQLGDVLITITGANVTKTGLVSSDIGTAYVSQHVALCRPSKEIDSDFMYWFLIAEPAGRRQLTKYAYGAGKPGLNLDNIQSVEINLPPISEQKEIVNKIKELLSIEENIASSIEAELIRIELLRQSILKKAFSGQLVSQDPRDEPASELLARIQAEKAAALAQPKPTPVKRGLKAKEATHG
jgi:type I restriction enzyme S subunit